MTAIDPTVRAEVATVRVTSAGLSQDVRAIKVVMTRELIRFRHIDPEYCGASPTPCLFEVQLQADAAIDTVLDITANDRSLTVAALRSMSRQVTP